MKETKIALLFLLARMEKKENCKSVDLQCLNSEVIIICACRLVFNNQSTNKQTNKHGLFFVIIARQDSKLSVTALCISSLNSKKTHCCQYNAIDPQMSWTLFKVKVGALIQSWWFIVFCQGWPDDDLFLECYNKIN